MSDSETQAELERSLDSVIETIEKVPPILTGDPADVTLTISVSGAMTPQEAVDQFMMALGRGGSNAMFFFVEDSDGEQYAIRDGRLYDPAELVKVAPVAPAQDDDEDDESDPE